MADGNMDVNARLKLETSQFDGPLKNSTHLADASANAVAAANQRSAKVVAISAKLAGDAVTQQAMQQVKANDLVKASRKDLATLNALVNKTDQDQAALTELRAVATQRLTEATLAQAAASKIEAAATEATILTQRSAVSAVVRASEGQQGIRAVEGFLTMIPGVGAAIQAIFPLVGGAMFLSLLVKMGDELYKVEQKAVHAAEATRNAFADLHDKAQVHIDDLQIENDKLDEQIAKLGGHPGDGLALALDEARKNADKLLESLQADRKELEGLLKENSVGTIAATLTSQSPSSKQESEMLADQMGLTSALRKANADYEQALLGDKTPGAIKASTDVRNKAVADAYAAQIAVYRKESARLKQEQKDSAEQLELSNASPEPINNSKKIANIEGRIQQLTDAATIEHLTENIDAKKIITDGHKGPSDESVQHKQFEAMKAALEQQKMLHGETLAEEKSYWEKMLASAKTGSELYRLIVPEIVKAQQAILGEFVRSSIQAAEAATRENAEIHASLTKTWQDLNKQDSETARDRYAAMSAVQAGASDKRIQDMMGTDQVRELQLRLAPVGDAARQTAAMHATEYDARRSDLDDKMTTASSAPGDTPAEVEARVRQVEAIQKEIDALGRQWTVQQAEDDARIRNTTLLGGASDALAEFVRGATDAGAAMKQWFSGSLNATNDAIVRDLTTRVQHGQHVWGGVGHEVFTNATGSLLKGAEGSMLKGLGVGKLDGSSEASALWVRMSTGAPKHAAATAALRLPGVIPFSGSAGKGGGSLFGTPNELDGGDSAGDGSNADASAPASGFKKFVTQIFGKGNTDSSSGSGVMSSLAGIALHLIPGFANGGDYPTNSLIQVGEQGPEIMRTGSTPGTIIPNHALGGSVVNLHFNTDARGATDPAQVEAAINRSHQVMGPKYVAAAMQAMNDRNARLPSSRRR